MIAVLTHWYRYAKLHVGVVGGAAVWAATNYPDTPLGRYAVIVVGFLAATGLWAAPHEKEGVAGARAKARVNKRKVRPQKRV